MKELIKKTPLLKHVHHHYAATKYKQKFAEDCYGCFWGVFDTFEEAIRSAPATKNIGYDRADLAQEYQIMLDRGDWESSTSMVRAFDYPVLYWIGKITQNTTLNHVRFFDFGGNLGIHFLNYANYLDFPSTLQWIVCDLPEIVKVGTLVSKDPRLTFTTDFELANGSDIFLASGSIQYVNDDIATKINALEQKPQHLLINRIGLYKERKLSRFKMVAKFFIHSLYLIEVNLLVHWS